MEGTDEYGTIAEQALRVERYIPGSHFSSFWQNSLGNFIGNERGEEEEEGK